jgi:hypothetical protein
VCCSMSSRHSHVFESISLTVGHRSNGHGSRDGVAWPATDKAADRVL